MAAGRAGGSKDGDPLNAPAVGSGVTRRPKDPGGDAPARHTRDPGHAAPRRPAPRARRARTRLPPEAACV
eukprot:13923240-Alexandrium_andersonii.AAC.1